MADAAASTELEACAAADGALFRKLVADGYDKCADAYLKQHAAENPDDMRLEPFKELMAELSVGAHVLDAGCGAGVPIATGIFKSGQCCFFVL